MFDGVLGQDAEGKTLAVVGEEREPGVAGQRAQGGGGREGGDLFGEGVGVKDEVADAEGKKAVELFVGGIALVEGFKFLEDVLEIAGGNGGGVAVDEADARQHDGVFVEAGPMGFARPQGDREGVGGAAGVGRVVGCNGGIGGVFARKAAEAGGGLGQALPEHPCREKKGQSGGDSGAGLSARGGEKAGKENGEQGGEEGGQERIDFYGLPNHGVFGDHLADDADGNAFEGSVDAQREQHDGG